MQLNILAAAFALATAASTAQAESASPSQPDADPDAKSCAAQYFAQFVSPSGPPGTWRPAADFPAGLVDQPGEEIRDAGDVTDGYIHRLHTDHEAGQVYVSSIGGFSGERRVYGPFPVPTCPANEN